jgi:hypothetical protein
MTLFAITLALVPRLSTSVALGLGFVALHSFRYSQSGEFNGSSNVSDSGSQEPEVSRTLILRRRHVRHGRNTRDLGLAFLLILSACFMVMAAWSDMIAHCVELDRGVYDVNALIFRSSQRQ